MSFPGISDFYNVGEYFYERGINFRLVSVKETVNPADDLICFKYTIEFETNKDRRKIMRVSMYGTHSQYISCATISYWNIVYNIFALARLSLVNSYKDFCIQLGIEQNKEAKKLYNRSKYHWNRFVDLGLDRIDIEVIANQAHDTCHDRHIYR